MPPTSAHPTVLVVDDHPAAREVLSRLLEAEGYGVVVATDGADALEKLKHDKRIRVVVTDVAMPDMTGVELAYHLREHFPGLAVAIVSGDIAELERSVIARAGVPFIKKPVRAEALYDAVTEAMLAVEKQGV